MFVTAILDGMMVKYVIFKLFNHTNVQSVNVVLAIGALYVNILAASGGVWAGRGVGGGRGGLCRGVSRGRPQVPGQQR